MARPTKLTVDYFPHIINKGKTLFILEENYGNDGYAFWFKILELLGSTKNHYYDCNNPAEWKFLLAKTRFDEENANRILNLLSELNAIDKELWDKRIIFSQNFIDNIQDVYKRRGVNVITKDDIMSLCKHKPHLKDINDSKKPQIKLNKIKVNKTKVKETKDRDLVSLFSEIESNFTEEELKSKQEFLEYWKEKNPNGKKERWQMEEVFDVNRRFRTWLRNEKKWQRKKLSNYEITKRNILEELEELKKTEKEKQNEI